MVINVIGNRDGRRFGFCCSGRHTSALVLEAGLGIQNLDPGHGTCAGLTVIRVVPIFLSLAGTGESVSSRLFLGWFGPRGLASIVFAVIVMDANLPGGRFISAVVVTTVILSLVAHGVSAKPLAAWLGKKEAKRVAR